MSREWWVISGEAIIEALRRAHAGDDPEVVYTELYANSTEPDDAAESAEAALATARREADEMRARLAAVGHPMTIPEQAKIAKAFERDRWAGEWNSLPTAIDNLLADRAALANPSNDPNGAS